MVKNRLRLNFSEIGLHQKVVHLLARWFEVITASVVVGGDASAVKLLINHVFQGMMLGSVLWNLFYENARHAVNWWVTKN